MLMAQGSEESIKATMCSSTAVIMCLTHCAAIAWRDHSLAVCNPVDKQTCMCPQLSTAEVCVCFAADGIAPLFREEQEAAAGVAIKQNGA